MFFIDISSQVYNIDMIFYFYEISNLYYIMESSKYNIFLFNFWHNNFGFIITLLFSKIIFIYNKIILN